jgi:hypothetical protein
MKIYILQPDDKRLSALRRDLSERTTLAELAVGSAPPVVTFTDGLMEIWGARDFTTPEEVSEFQRVWMNIWMS